MSFDSIIGSRNIVDNGPAFDKSRVIAFGSNKNEVEHVGRTLQNDAVAKETQQYPVAKQPYDDVVVVRNHTDNSTTTCRTPALDEFPKDLFTQQG